jgi:hypothetical protein
MRIFFHVIALILLFPSVCLSDSTISDDNQIILKDAENKTWVPNKEETQKALTEIYNFINKPERYLSVTKVWTTDTEYLKKEIQKIYKNIYFYRVQFVGITKNGKRIIYCNFFRGDESNNYWKRELVRVADGGFWFWQVEFSPDENKIVWFQSNGYA